MRRQRIAPRLNSKNRRQLSHPLKAAAEPIKEPEFYSSLMKIWLGNNPADGSLKEALLGVAKPKPAGPEA